MALQLKNGTYVPGSTTILGLLDKPFLVPWANKLGKQQIDVQEYVDQAAKQGELIHLILDSHIMKEEIDLDKYSDEEIRIGEEAFNRYMEWERNHTIEFPEVEKELVSETYKYGGKLDFYCLLDGKWTIIDFKTSNKISIDQKIQVSSYENLVRENGLKVEQLLILNVGKTDGFKLQVEEIPFKDSTKYFKMFTKLIDVYYLKKELEWK